MIGPARYWREIPQRYRYEAARCRKCGKVFFPPRLVCNECRSRQFSRVTLPQTGTLETFTIIRVAPTGFGDEAPYAVGVIQLAEGLKVTAQVVDCDPETLTIGQKLRLEFRKVQEGGESGVLYYGYKFVPA